MLLTPGACAEKAILISKPCDETFLTSLPILQMKYLENIKKLSNCAWKSPPFSFTHYFAYASARYHMCINVHLFISVFNMLFLLKFSFPFLNETNCLPKYLLIFIFVVFTYVGLLTNLSQKGVRILPIIKLSCPGQLYRPICTREKLNIVPSLPCLPHCQVVD